MAIMHYGDNMYGPKDPASGFDLAKDIADRADSTIGSLHNARSCPAPERNWCIAALGGYGRQELCPFSDLDILVLVRPRTPASRIEAILAEVIYPLWDKGLDASYSVRTIRQCIFDAKKDFFLKTSLIDARYICGDQSLFEELARSFQRGINTHGLRRFIRQHKAHTLLRNKRYGDCAFGLEPDIKNSRGGLRDYHVMMWIYRLSKEIPDHRGLIDPVDMDCIQDAADFLLKIRIHLHLLTEKKTDTLRPEHIDRLKEMLGFNGTGRQDLIKTYREKALSLHMLCDTYLSFIADRFDQPFKRHRRSKDEFLDLTNGFINIKKPECLAASPLIVMEVFMHMAEKDLMLSPSALSSIKGFVSSDDTLERSMPARSMFLDVLKSDHPEKALVAMLSTGIIEKVIPEFSRIKGLSIFDVLHTHTVDFHSIRTIGMLRGLKGSMHEIFSRVKDLDTLHLGAFLHDIGKGSGMNHSIRGSQIIRMIAPWFGLDAERTDRLVFLVRNHLLLSRIALKRDLTEEKVIHDLARAITDTEMLDMLYLISAADSMATGEGEWNEWKASLLKELYIKLSHTLENNMFKDQGNASRLEENWQGLIDHAVRHTDIKGRLWALPQSYILSSSIEAIKRHLTLAALLDKTCTVKTDLVERKGHHTLTVIAKDRPGLFAMITGVLALSPHSTKMG